MAKQGTGKSKKQTKPKAKKQAMDKTKRNTKDSVFTHLFSFSKYQLELYKTLHPEDTDVCEADIGTITRECVVATHEHNDLGILIKDRLMVFVEAQSSWSPNIVIRLMSYAIQSLMDYFRERDVYLYSSTKVFCPRIELYTIFSCTCENMPNTLSLRDAFFPKDGCDLDATVHIIQFDDKKTDIINQYIMFCRVFNDQIKKYGYSSQAIRETLRICRDEGILSEYIKKMEGEIMDIMAYMFDEENNKRLFGLEQWRLGEEKGREEGRNEGRVEGRVEGREEGQKLTAINLLNMNMDISFIEKATGLSKEEILKLKK
ncbi:MAG: hypothetical protein IIY06_11430 [Proteobacteria bacterium]|nr:hypothetical protein [Pseudomonadota bacterium]